MKCINCGAEFEAERCPECGLSRKYNKVLYRYYERHPEQEARATHDTTAVKCVNCGMVFEHENCPRCGLSRKNNRILYRYEERQREKRDGNYHSQKKSKKRKKNMPRTVGNMLRIVGGVILVFVGLFQFVGSIGDILNNNNDSTDEAFKNNDNNEVMVEAFNASHEDTAAEPLEIEDEETESFGEYMLTKTTFADGSKKAEIDICAGNKVTISFRDDTSLATYTGDGTALAEEVLFFNGFLFSFAMENGGVAGIMTKDANGKEISQGYIFKDGELVTTSGEMPEDRYDALNDDDLQGLNGQDFAAVTSAASEFLTGKPFAGTSAITREEIKAQATSATYQDFLRDPDAHKGEYVVLTVRLQQVLDDSGFLSSETYYFGYTDNSGYELYFDDQYCFTDSRVDDKTKLLKDDILTVYGVFTGTGEFERALVNTSVEIPMVEMLYVDIGGAVQANNDELLAQMVVNEYKYSTEYWHYAFLEIENTSDTNVKLTANVNFYDKDDNLVGAKSSEESAFESGTKTLLSFMPDEPFARMEYELEIGESLYECVVSELSYESTPAQNKEIVSVTNNGDEPASFVEGYALFFEDGKVVDYDRTYFIDDDNELKPGKTEAREMNCYEEYDSVQFYFSGRR